MSRGLDSLEVENLKATNITVEELWDDNENINHVELLVIKSIEVVTYNVKTFFLLEYSCKKNVFCGKLICNVNSSHSDNLQLHYITSRNLSLRTNVSNTETL